jgi:energy-coupling factor transport system ATP-binding protein
MATNELVKVDRVTFTYERGPTALKDVSFTINRGEVIAVMGANGAGKTTLCFHLNGVIPMVYAGTEKGRITVAGLDPWETPIIELSQHVSMVLQDPESQFVTNDVKSELAFGPANLAVPKDEILDRIDFASKVCGLEGLHERRPADLSGGQKQRVAFGAGLTMLPDLLVLDEPTSQLDPVGTAEVLDTLNGLTKEEDLSIVITSHKTEKVAEFADRVIVLNEGELVETGSPREVFSHVEKLDSVGVNPPQVTILCKRLADKIPGFEGQYQRRGGIPITLDEAYDLLTDLLDQGFIKIDWKEPPQYEQPSEETVLETSDLVHVYEGREPVTALRGVDIDIKKGEIVSIIGQNGSGKTTLVKHFLGLLNATEGKVNALGNDVTKMTTGELAKTIQLILQNPDFQLFSISAEKEIRFGLENLKLPEEEIEKRVDDALKRANLEDKREIFPFRLSFGNRRQLAAAAGIAMGPDILILDEPTTAQDYRGRHRICQIAKDMQKEGKTILMISHDMELMATYAPRTIVLADGKKVADAPTREVFGMHDIMEQADITPPQISQLAEKLKDYGIKDLLLTVDEMVDVIERGGA